MEECTCTKEKICDTCEAELCSMDYPSSEYVLEVRDEHDPRL